MVSSSTQRRFFFCRPIANKQKATGKWLPVPSFSYKSRDATNGASTFKIRRLEADANSLAMPGVRAMGNNPNERKTMKWFRSLKFRFHPRPNVLPAIAGILAVSLGCIIGADTNSVSAAKPEKKAAKKEKQKLTGAELYAIHCNRCHPERYATERTDAQWKTIMMHMQVRAQLPGKDAKAILKYLQENN
jgi:hypothetical protein